MTQHPLPLIRPKIRPVPDRSTAYGPGQLQAEPTNPNSIAITLTLGQRCVLYYRAKSACLKFNVPSPNANSWIRSCSTLSIRHPLRQSLRTSVMETAEQNRCVWHCSIRIFELIEYTNTSLIRVVRFCCCLDSHVVAFQRRRRIWKFSGWWSMIDEG